jgi:GH43 family beta-xylosidase
MKDTKKGRRIVSCGPFGCVVVYHSDQVAALTGDPYDRPHHHQMLEAVSLERGRMDAVIV